MWKYKERIVITEIIISFTFHTDTSLLMLIVLVWWLWRMCNTRSHPELDSETVQRLWYFVLRHGKVGRCQTYTINIKSIFLSKCTYTKVYHLIFPYLYNRIIMRRHFIAQALHYAHCAQNWKQNWNVILVATYPCACYVCISMCTSIQLSIPLSPNQYAIPLSLWESPAEKDHCISVNSSQNVIISLLVCLPKKLHSCLKPSWYLFFN